MDYSYSVLIRNYCGTSFHTWLIFNTGRCFSLCPPNEKCAINCNCKPKLETDEFAQGRIYTDEAGWFYLTRAEYELMIQKMSEFESGTYALVPSGTKDDEYNCVTACRKILQAGGNTFLNDVNTPVGVGLKILNDPSYEQMDAIVSMYGLLPKISAEIVRCLRFRRKNGVRAWIVGIFWFGLNAGIFSFLIFTDRRFHVAAKRCLFFILSRVLRCLQECPRCIMNNATRYAGTVVFFEIVFESNSSKMK